MDADDGKMNGSIYIAFLRGINVGGNTAVPMAALKTVLTGQGFQDVKTVLNSGNAVFKTEETDRSALARKIQAALRETFGFEIAVMLRSGEEIRALLKAEPFMDTPVTPETRLYVTFLGEGVESRTKAPFVSPQGDFGVVRVFPREVCTFVILSPGRGTPEMMKGIEQAYGKTVTTRSWNTIERIGKLLA